MKERKFTVVILKDGRIVIDDPDFRSGQKVEVVVRIEEEEKRPPAWPLRGLPVKYHRPFAPAIDPTEWDADS